MSTDWTSARDLALACVETTFNVSLGIASHAKRRPLFKLPRLIEAIERSQALAIKAGKAITPETTDAIALALAKSGHAGFVRWGQLTFTTAHEASLTLIERLLLSLPVNANPFDRRWDDPAARLAVLLRETPDDERETMLAGAADYFRKGAPIPYEELRARINLEWSLVCAATGAVPSNGGTKHKERTTKKTYKPRSEDAKAIVEELELGKRTRPQIIKRLQVTEGQFDQTERRWKASK